MRIKTNQAAGKPTQILLKGPQLVQYLMAIRCKSLSNKDLRQKSFQNFLKSLFDKHLL